MLRKLVLKTLNKYASKWVVLGFDILLVCFAFITAYAIRFNLSFNFDATSIKEQLLLVIGASLISFLLVGSYKGIIRHTGTKDIFNVFIGASLCTLCMGFIVLVNQFLEIYKGFTIPKSIILIHYLVAIFVLTVSRYAFKAFYEIISTELKTIKNVLIYGAGNSGIITYGALNRERGINYDIQGFIDDDRNKINKKIDRIKIHNPSKIHKEFIEKNDIHEIIISVQNIKPTRLLEITDEFIALGVQVKIVPPLSKWIGGHLQVNQIKQINIDDLLGRDKISIENPIVKREVANKVVLVTGAAGSIGSEISRQLSSYNLELLILIDQAESPLYDLQQELIQNGESNFKAIVADVRDFKRMEAIFAKYKPQKVFHAAAYKHVPLMEESPYEAIKINVFGTKVIADLSLKYKVKRFVMVSSDKAVNPTNVMGATKRVAELYVSCLSNEKSNTKFTITRFGNVLGSNGSVIPLFKKQIEKGGPLTLTHREITRYFMTIPEACSLVLEAGAMGDGGEIYIFDMGKSIKIFDLAKRMISLSGFVYPDDIDIKITGLRPGEKLYEELLANDENTIKTYHEKIMIAKSLVIDCFKVKNEIIKLTEENINFTNHTIVASIKEIVPEYISNNSEYEKLDKIPVSLY
ncbi:putative capsular polysaccharide biosynthesis protein [Polaribacter irgensii 23-P]|uniref:Putative capsular polysaccharide biosynthesis protein n=1 Tax=Polaribacter irgensii 23-P TaxID=313594 RepID=A4BYN3_9FLAO|nr:nucleoside-diphosphate sugar epimerase/dehydratase [Polaribacter irgensii]EAR12276.1 putative capsular polysaccharide biosynthesis protein [Polaribacter irgensii 23-P]